MYWAQSVVIGLANFLDIITLGNIKPGSLTMNDKPLGNTASAKGCAGVFFLIHFGAFCLGHLIFLLIKIKGNFSFGLFKIGLGIICISVAMDFIRKKKSSSMKKLTWAKPSFSPICG